MLTIPVSGALAAKYIRQVASGGTTARSETCIVAVMLKTRFILGVTYLIEIMSTALGSGPTASRPLSWSKAKSVTWSPAGPGRHACGLTPPSGGGVRPDAPPGVVVIAVVTCAIPGDPNCARNWPGCDPWHEIDSCVHVCRIINFHRGLPCGAVVT